MKGIKTEYRRIQNRNYLVISFADKEAMEKATGHYGLQMASANKITGLVPLEYRKQDESFLFFYEIGGLQSLSSVLEKQKLDSSALKNILICLARTIEEMKEYLLSPRDLFVDPSYIFGKENTPFLQFCYVPGTGDDFFADLSELLSLFLSYMEEKEEYGVVLAYQLYQKSLKPGYTMEELLDILSAKEEDLFLEEAARVKEESGAKDARYRAAAVSNKDANKDREDDPENLEKTPLDAVSESTKNSRTPLPPGSEQGFRLKNIFSKKRGDEI